MNDKLLARMQVLRELVIEEPRLVNRDALLSDIDQIIKLIDALRKIQSSAAYGRLSRPAETNPAGGKAGAFGPYLRFAYPEKFVSPHCLHEPEVPATLTHASDGTYARCRHCGESFGPLTISIIGGGGGINKGDSRRSLSVIDFGDVSTSDLVAIGQQQLEQIRKGMDRGNAIKSLSLQEVVAYSKLRKAGRILYSEVTEDEGDALRALVKRGLAKFDDVAWSRVDPE